MPAYKGHSVRCERAGSARCACRCTGVYHGLPGVLAYARNEPRAIADVEKWRVKTANTYEAERVKPSNRRSGGIRTKPYQKASVDFARIEIVTNLRSILDRNHDEVQQTGKTTADILLEDTEQFVDRLYDDVVGDLVGRDPRSSVTNRSDLHKVLADHTWCEVIARIAGWLATAQRWVGRVPQTIVRLLEEFRATSDSKLERELIRFVVEGTWSALGRLSTLRETLLTGPLVVTRVMGSTLCKAPDGHRTVMQNCVVPLKGYLTLAVRELLVDAFPSWLTESPEAVTPTPATIG